jgi:hypothetical protein
MTDTGAPPPDDGDETAEPRVTFALDEALERLKRTREPADDATVSTDGSTRMSWSSVTEADPATEPEREPAPPAAPSRESSFSFDLGSALARLGDPDQAEPASIEPPPSDASPSVETPARGGPPPDTAMPDRQATPPPSDLPQRDAAAAGALPQREAPTAERAAQADDVHPAAEQAPTAEGLSQLDETHPPDDLPRREAAPTSDLPRREPAPSADLPRRTAPPAADLPRREPPSATDDLPRRESAGPAGDLPRRSAPSAPPAAAAAPVVQPTQPSAPDPTPSGGNRSVFAAANPAPTLPRNPQRMPGAEPAAPVLPPSTALPTLPASNPSSPPPMVDNVGDGVAAPDIHAVRSYQLRAERDRRRGKVIGRSLMFIVLLAAAAAAAVFFGRDLLFPTQWDASLTPLVDEVQLARGQDFSDTVPLEVVDDEEYVSIALSAVLGDDWAEMLPQWRALGIANGGATADSTTAAVVAWRPTIYDHETETIYRASSADPDAAASASRLALEEAFEHQLGVTPNSTFTDDRGGVIGVSSTQAIASHAIDQALLVGSATEVAEFDATIQTPLPVLYELLAVDVFGEPLLEAEAIDPAPVYGDRYPDNVLDLLAVDADRAAFGLLPNEAQSLAPATALGADGWRLIWQNRLPPSTVDRITSIMAADVYQPVMLGTSSCFFAVFETANDLDGAELLAAMTTWVGEAPVEAQAIATPVSPTRVEVQACDPGTSVDQPVDAAGVTTLVERQLARLG